MKGYDFKNLLINANLMLRAANITIVTLVLIFRSPQRLYAVIIGPVIVTDSAINARQGKQARPLLQVRHGLFLPGPQSMTSHILRSRQFKRVCTNTRILYLKVTEFVPQMAGLHLHPFAISAPEGIHLLRSRPLVSAVIGFGAAGSRI